MSVIAFKLLPEFPESGGWYSLMEALVKLNPSVLANTDIGIIQAGTLLKLPAKDSTVNEANEMVMHPLQSRDEIARQRRKEPSSEILAAPNDTSYNTSYNKIGQALAIRATPENVYVVSAGYSISMVAIQLFPDFPEYGSWSGLMRSLHELNPDAFIDNDINQLRSNVPLRLPVTIRY
nr:hypothetical protein [Endozoicomonas sp.]